jgi:hypothetical protein
VLEEHLLWALAHEWREGRLFLWTSTRDFDAVLEEPDLFVD